MLDFGGQYSQLIARRVRECGVFSELLPHTSRLEEIERAPAARADPVRRARLGVCRRAPRRFPTELLELGHPGARHLLRHAGDGARRSAAASRAPRSGEFGRSELTVLDGGGRLLAGPAGRAELLDEPPRHGLRAAAGLHGARLHGSPVAAFEAPERGLYGIQFHPEVVHTPYGTEILERFLREICGCEEQWSPASVIDEQVARDPRPGRRRPGDLRALGRGRLLGGGAARPPRGGRPADLRVRRPRADAQERGRAGGRRLPATSRCRWSPSTPRSASSPASPASTTPSRSARSSARSSSASSRRRPSKLEDVGYLVQGTLYSDVIESGGGTGAATIKSHHNVGGLPEDLEFELVEPLRMLFKDEVRAVGAELGLPDRMVWRQPFPGPGPGDPDRRRRGQPGAASRSCATPTRSSRRRSAPPASTASSGSRSACCRWCAPSACRATSAPTPTRS